MSTRPTSSHLLQTGGALLSQIRQLSDQELILQSNQAARRGYNADYKTYELRFAQSLGVNLESLVEWRVLLPAAIAAMRKLPPGYEICLGTGEYANVPYFYDKKTDESYWHHPRENEIREELSRIIDAVGINASSELKAGNPSQDRRKSIDQNKQAAEPVNIAQKSRRNTVDGASITKALSTQNMTVPNRRASIQVPLLKQLSNVIKSRVSSDADSFLTVEYQQFEIIFGLTFRVDVSINEHFLYLMPIVAEQLQKLPDGYQMYIGQGQHENFPFFHNSNTGASSWNHPREDEIREVINAAAARMKILLPTVSIENIDNANAYRASTPAEKAVTEAKLAIRRASTAPSELDQQTLTRPATSSLRRQSIVPTDQSMGSNDSDTSSESDGIRAYDNGTAMAILKDDVEPVFELKQRRASSADIRKSISIQPRTESNPINEVNTKPAVTSASNDVPVRKKSVEISSVVSYEQRAESKQQSPPQLPATVPSLALPVESNHTNKVDAPKSPDDKKKLVLKTSGSNYNLPVSVFTPMSVRSAASYGSYLTYGSEESYSTQSSGTSGFYTGRDSESYTTDGDTTPGPSSTRSNSRRYFRGSKLATPTSIDSGYSDSTGTDSFETPTSRKSHNNNGSLSRMFARSPKRRKKSDDLSTIVSVGSDTESRMDGGHTESTDHRQRKSSSIQIPHMATIPDTDGNLSPLSNDASAFLNLSSTASLEGSQESLALDKSSEKDRKHQEQLASPKDNSSLTSTLSNHSKKYPYPAISSSQTVPNAVRSTIHSMNSSNSLDGKLRASSPASTRIEGKSSKSGKSSAISSPKGNGSKDALADAAASSKVNLSVAVDKGRSIPHALPTNSTFMSQDSSFVTYGEESSFSSGDGMSSVLHTGRRIPSTRRNKQLFPSSTRGSSKSNKMKLSESAKAVYSFDNIPEQSSAEIASEPQKPSSPNAVTIAVSDNEDLNKTPIKSPASVAPASVKSSMGKSGGSTKSSASNKTGRVDALRRKDGALTPIHIKASDNKSVLSKTVDSPSKSSVSSVSRVSLANSPGPKSQTNDIIDILNADLDSNVIATDGEKDRPIVTKTLARDVSQDAIIVQQHGDEIIVKLQTRPNTVDPRVLLTSSYSATRGESRPALSRSLSSSKIQDYANVLSQASNMKTEVTITINHYNKSDIPTMKSLRPLTGMSPPASKQVVTQATSPIAQVATPMSQANSKISQGLSIKCHTKSPSVKTPLHQTPLHNDTPKSQEATENHSVISQRSPTSDRKSEALSVVIQTTSLMSLLSPAMTDTLPSLVEGQDKERMDEELSSLNIGSIENAEASVDQAVDDLAAIETAETADEVGMDEAKVASSQAERELLETIKAQRKNQFCRLPQLPKLSKNKSNNVASDEDVKMKFLARAVKIPSALPFSAGNSSYLESQLKQNLNIALASDRVESPGSIASPVLNKATNDDPVPVSHPLSASQMDSRINTGLRSAVATVFSKRFESKSSEILKEQLQRNSFGIYHPLWPSVQSYESWKTIAACDTLYHAKLIRKKLIKKIKANQKKFAMENDADPLLSAICLSNKSKGSKQASKDISKRLDMIHFTYSGTKDVSEIIRLRLESNDVTNTKWVVETTSNYVMNIFYGMESDSYMDYELLKHSTNKAKKTYTEMMLKCKDPRQALGLKSNSSRSLMQPESATLSKGNSMASSVDERSHEEVIEAVIDAVIDSPLYVSKSPEVSEKIQTPLHIAEVTVGDLLEGDVLLTDVVNAMTPTVAKDESRDIDPADQAIENQDCLSFDDNAVMSNALEVATPNSLRVS